MSDGRDPLPGCPARSPSAGLPRKARQRPDRPDAAAGGGATRTDAAQGDVLPTTPRPHRSAFLLRQTQKMRGEFLTTDRVATDEQQGVIARDGSDDLVHLRLVDG